MTNYITKGFSDNIFKPNIAVDKTTPKIPKPTSLEEVNSIKSNYTNTQNSEMERVDKFRNEINQLLSRYNTV